jgi:hypothetical protein
MGVKGAVTGDGGLSRNGKYEQRRKDLGQVKLTLWIPETAEVELKQVANFCCENPEYIPFMVRSTRTGKMKKGV